MDKYAHIRDLPFPVVAPSLGIDLKRFKVAGNGEWVGYCAIHQSKTNQSCFRYASDGKFHCFSCSAKGRGALDLAKAVRSIGFKEAVAILEPLVGQAPVQAPMEAPATIPEATEAVLKPIEKDTWRKYQVPCEWLEQRIPYSSVLEQYGVFCYNNPSRKSAYSGRVMIPVKDGEGKIFGYLGRNPDNPTDTPKYLFPKNLPKSRFVFGAYELGQRYQLPVKVVYVVESPFCVMRFASLGLPALSPYGWSVSEEQIRLLASLAKGAIYLPDSNKAGLQSAEVVQAMSQAVWVRSPRLPKDVIDPEYLDKEAILALTH